MAKNRKAGIKPALRYTSGEKEARVVVRILRIPVVDIRALVIGIAEIDEVAVPRQILFAQFRPNQKCFAPPKFSKNFGGGSHLYFKPPSANAVTGGKITQAVYLPA